MLRDSYHQKVKKERNSWQLCFVYMAWLAHVDQRPRLSPANPFIKPLE